MANKKSDGIMGVMQEIDVDKLSEEELNQMDKQVQALTKSIHTRRAIIEEEKMQKRIEENSCKLDFLRQHKDLVLKILDVPHVSVHCSDTNVCNDYVTGGQAECPRCMLITMMKDQCYDFCELDIHLNIKEIR